jgi:glycosyltransferase involved in cell wall biosynthesis
MRALVIAPQPFFSTRGTPISVYYRLLSASKLGVKIDLLTYGQGQDVDIPNLNIIRIPRFGFLGPVKIGPSVLKAFLDIFMVIWTVILLSKNRYHFVHAHEEAVFFCRILKPIFGFKLLADMHSSLPQQLRNFRFTQSKILIGLFQILERSSLHASDAVISVYPYLYEYVNDIVKDRRKSFLIENSLSGFIKTIPVSGYSNPANMPNKVALEEPVELPPDKKFVVYAGTLEVYQGIELLLSAFKIVTDKVSDAFLLVIGGNKIQVKHYLEIAETCGLNGCVHLMGRISQRMTKYYLNSASVLVSPRSHGFNTPLKIYEQLASGIPLVATNIPAHTQVLNDDVALLVEPEPADLARGIVRGLISDEDRIRIIENAAKFYMENYSPDVYDKKVRQVVELLSE